MNGASGPSFGSEILATGKTPDQWVEVLVSRGIRITERTLREKANRLGARFKIGNAMIITPSQLDRILTESQGCRSNPTNADRSTGSGAGSNTTVDRIAGPYRKSTRATTEAGARDWIRDETELQIRKHVIGEEHTLRFADAVQLYVPSPKTAKQLLPILEVIGDLPIGTITGALLKSLGPKLKPNACTDTWWREIVTPTRAVINNAHEFKGTPLLRVKRYDKFERIAQDQRRQKTSRVERIPATREWIEAFCAAADPYNAAMARFMFETAARIDQAVSIEPEDLRSETCEVQIKAQKGHTESWITVSPEMMAEITALQPKRPKNLKTGQLSSPRVFGYGSPTGYNNRWKMICKRAGIPYLSAHPAGRHGFFTELVVRQGVDPVTAAKAGRWSDPNLPMRNYAHAETDEAAIRARFRTKHVQTAKTQSPKKRKTKKEINDE